MATISEKQVSDINAQCRNGFRFDMQAFMQRGDKELCKCITIKDNVKAVKLTLSWSRQVVKELNQFGCTVPRFTGQMIPRLRCSVWHKSDNSPFWCSHGLGNSHEFTEYASPKRLMKTLCAATELVTDSLVLSLIPDYEREAFLRATASDNEQLVPAVE